MERIITLTAISLSGKPINGISISDSDTILDLKQKIVEIEPIEIDFKIVYAGKNLTNDNEIFFNLYREGQNKLYLLPIGVKGGCGNSN